VITREGLGDNVLVVSASRRSFLAFSPRYCSDPFQELNRQLDTQLDTVQVEIILNYDTLIAAKWIVWGMHRMRASFAENKIPRSLHRDSSDVISVLLLLALSIIIAMICECVSGIH
jgi:hypothetical protein